MFDRMRNFVTLAALASALLVVPAVAYAEAGAPPGYVVIVHANVKSPTMSRDDVRAMFAKKTTRWPEDVLVVPFDLAPSNPTRAAFSQAIYGKSPQAVLLEWRQRIFTGTGTPPREVKDDAAMIATVAATAGGIGYVHAATQLPPHVRAVTIVFE